MRVDRVSMMIRLILLWSVLLMWADASARTFDAGVKCALLNGAPVAVNDESYDDQGIIQYGNVSLNDFDPDGDPLTYTVIEEPANGTIVMQPTGVFSYEPDEFYYGFDYVTYQVCDPSGLCATAIIEIAVFFVNDPPVMVDETYYIQAGQPFTANVGDNDIEPDNEVIFYNVLVAPTNVTGFSLGTFGQVSFTPDPGFTGTLTLVYQGCDPCVVCDIGVATFIVSSNDPPVAQDDEHFTNMNAPLDLSVAQNDSDPNGDELTYSVIGEPAHGTIVIEPDGSYLYTPDPYFAGFDQVSYQVCDPFGACDQATLYIEVVFVNVNPVGVDDTFTGPEDGVISGNVGDNDYDLNIEVLTFFLISPPSVGTLDWNTATGDFTYTPPAGWSGSVMAVYNVCDPCNACDVAVLNLHVEPVNDAPVAQDFSFSVQEDGSHDGDLAAYADDEDSVNLLFSTVQQPVHGTLTVDPSGTFTYQPAGDYSGPDTFVFSVCDDDGACDQATASITVTDVNDPPVILGETYTMSEDGVLSQNVSANDSDPEGDAITYSVVSGPLHGQLVLQPGGAFVYTPDLNYNGEDSFVYQGCDPYGACNQATADIVINWINDLPVAEDDDYQTQEDTPLTANVGENDWDVDDEPLFFNVLVAPSPAQGTVVMQADGEFTYTPALNFNGLATFIYLACDSCNACDAGVVSILVHPVNDAPLAQGETRTVNEDTVLSSTVAGNDPDPENSPVTYSVVQGPSHGVITLNTNGTFVYTPNPNFSGTDQVIYSVCDPQQACAQATLTIQVIPVNDPPVVVSEQFSVLMNGMLSGNVSDNDYDVEGSTLLYTLLTGPSSGVLTLSAAGVFGYTPAENFYGVVTATYSACDPSNACSTGTLTIEVISTNNDPVVQSETVSGDEDTVLTGDVSDNDTDADGHVLVYTLIQDTPFGDLNLAPDGGFTFIPLPDWNGTATVMYRGCDPVGACGEATLTLVVSPVNDAPVVSGETYSGDEDNLIAGDLSLNDHDADGDELNYSVVSGPAFGSLVLSTNGSFEYVPQSDFFGEDGFVYQACDAAGACGTGEVVLAVIPVNDAPVAQHDLAYVSSGEQLTGDVSLNDSDVDSEVLVYSLQDFPVNGEIEWNSDGTFVYTPADGFAGTEVLGYAVCDDGGLCDEAGLTIVVGAVNTPPVAATVSAPVCAGGAWSYDLNLVVSDAEDGNDQLNLEIVSGTGGIWTIDPDTHLAEFVSDGSAGAAGLIYSVCDVTLGTMCTQGMVELDVLAVSVPQVVSVELENVRCYGEENGSIAVTTDGLNDVCAWSTGEDDPAITGLPPGDYTLTIMRPGFCTGELVQVYTVSEPGPLLIEGLTSLPIADSPGGSSEYTVSGGNPSVFVCLV
jgi:large repetitive protein